MPSTAHKKRKTTVVTVEYVESMKTAPLWPDIRPQNEGQSVSLRLADPNDTQLVGRPRSLREVHSLVQGQNPIL